MSEPNAQKPPRQKPVDYDRAVKLGGAIARFRERATTAERRSAELETQVTNLTAENGKLKVASDSSLANKRIEELTSELRGVKHKQVFDKVAVGKGARPDGLSDLYKLSGYKPEADEADEAAIGLLIDSQRSERGYLFGEAKAEEGSTPPPPPKPGVGGGQGGAIKGAQKFTQEQLGDAGFVMRNYDAVVAYASEQAGFGNA